MANKLPPEVRAQAEVFAARMDQPLPADVLDRPVIFNLGMGVDSTAILLRWAFEPETRPVPWDQVAVVSAMTGNEWTQTADLVEQHLLPLLQMEGVRYVQVARDRREKSASDQALYRVLSDTNAPTRLYAEGAYSLGEELIEAGTVPQVGGTRKCSLKFKGEVIDPWLEDELGDQPFVQVMGFEDNERSRAFGDGRDGAHAIYKRNVRRVKGVKSKGIAPKPALPLDHRFPYYPLVEWGWDRQACLDYIEAVLGVRWEKSACVFCPFALSNKANRAETLKRYEAHPEHSLLALRIEFLSMSLNPEQKLLPKEQPSLGEMIDQVSWEGFTTWLASAKHSVYLVRRIDRESGQKPGTVGNTYRAVEEIATGTREQMLWELEKVSHREGLPVEHDGRDGLVRRVWLHKRNGEVNGFDHLYVTAPTGVIEKQLASFETWWDEAQSAERRGIATPQAI